MQVVPYSLHSNYEEIELFVSMVKPKVIRPIVKSDRNSEHFRTTYHTFEAYSSSLMYMKQRGLPFLINEYAQCK